VSANVEAFTAHGCRSLLCGVSGCTRSLRAGALGAG
jgi:hypothetical protein